MTLSEVLLSALPDANTVDVAVSGGLDSWLLAALLQSRGQTVRAWYLETGVPGYCERAQVDSLSQTLAIPCHCLRVDAADFLHSLPEFLAATRTPIYNLHPVSKLLLARELRRHGVTAVIAGDGADQVMRHEWNCDLIPLTRACFQHAGVRLLTPFWSDPFIAFCRRPDPHKRPLRDLARRLGLPALPKRPTLFPEEYLPLPGTCLDYTTALLEAMEMSAPCAASRA